MAKWKAFKDKAGPDLYELTLAGADLREAVDRLCALDADFKAIEAQAGPLMVLTLPPTFAALVRIVVGQQLSNRVAQAIYVRLAQTVSLEPGGFLEASDDTLRQVGLSRAKILCCRAAALAIHSGELDLAACQQLPEPAVFAALTALPGVGPWTAELFMLFALGRLDIFPVGDLAIRRAYGRLKGHAEPQSAKRILEAAEPLRPYRSAAAHLLWHSYRYESG